MCSKRCNTFSETNHDHSSNNKSSLVQCRGFTPALAGLKHEVNSRHSELPRENPGSKWPKTSFGAVKDNQRLTPENLSVLMDLCRQVTSSHVSRTLDHAAAKKAINIKYSGTVQGFQ